MPPPAGRALCHLGSRLKDAAILAFLHSLAGGCALVASFLLPARPRAPMSPPRAKADEPGAALTKNPQTPALEPHQ